MNTPTPTPPPTADLSSRPGYGLPSDIGNTLRFQESNTGTIRWNDKFGWMRFNGQTLQKVKLPWTEVQRLPDLIQAQANLTPNDDERKALRQWAEKSAAGTRLREAITQAEDPDSPLYIHEDQLDADPYALNTPSGMLDLRTLQLRPTTIEDAATKLTGTPYVPGAVSPTLERFLSEVLPDPEVRRYVQMCFGYSLLGDPEQECLFIFHGQGQNGKSKLIDAVNEALGSYSTRLADATLIETRREEHPTHIMKLKGARFAYLPEVPTKAGFNEATLKSMTGRDKNTGRGMREDYVDFPSTHTIFISANHMPKLSSVGKAIRRRIVVIPFSVTIPDDKVDPQLLEKLCAELEGVLAWCVEGLRMYYEADRKLDKPVDVELATETYLGSQDSPTRFVAECMVKDPEALTSLADISKAYSDWCSVEQVSQHGRTDLINALRAAGITDKATASRRGWTGRLLGSVSLPY